MNYSNKMPTMHSDTFAYPITRVNASQAKDPKLTIHKID